MSHPCHQPHQWHSWVLLYRSSSNSSLLFATNKLLSFFALGNNWQALSRFQMLSSISMPSSFWLTTCHMGRALLLTVCNVSFWSLSSQSSHSPETQLKFNKLNLKKVEVPTWVSCKTAWSTWSHQGDQRPVEDSFPPPITYFASFKIHPGFSNSQDIIFSRELTVNFRYEMFDYSETAWL